MKKVEKNLSDENNKVDLLAQIRTLLALERNFMAEERTNLSKLRTGLAFLLMAPPIYLFSISLQITFPLLIVIIMLLFLVISAILGIWMITKARSTLRKLRIKKKEIKNDNFCTPGGLSIIQFFIYKISKIHFSYKEIKFE